MKTVLFTFESPIGTFWLHPEPAGKVQLRLDGARLKTYGSAKAAARDVYNRSTGWQPWDELEGVRAPASLAQWKRGTTAKGRQRGRTDEISSTDESDVAL